MTFSVALNHAYRYCHNLFRRLNQIYIKVKNENSPCNHVKLISSISEKKSMTYLTFHVVSLATNF